MEGGWLKDGTTLMLIATLASFFFLLLSVVTAAINLHYGGGHRRVCRVEVAERTSPMGLDIRKVSRQQLEVAGVKFRELIVDPDSSSVLLESFSEEHIIGVNLYYCDNTLPETSSFSRYMFKTIQSPRSKQLSWYVA
jgi:hypothetical protein